MKCRDTRGYRGCVTLLVLAGGGGGGARMCQFPYLIIFDLERQLDRFRKIVVILFSSEINFNQGNHYCLIEYFKTNTFLQSINIIPCILFQEF